MELIFSLTLLLVAPVWLLMIGAPNAAITRRVALSPWSFVPVAAGYSLLLLLNLPAAAGALAGLSFAAIAAFLGSPLGVTLNWLHLSTSDLLVGRWIYAQTRERPLPAVAVGAILALCWVFAPLGLIVYLIARRWWPAGRA